MFYICQIKGPYYNYYRVAQVKPERTWKFINSWIPVFLPKTLIPFIRDEDLEVLFNSPNLHGWNWEGMFRECKTEQEFDELRRLFQKCSKPLFPLTATEIFRHLINTENLLQGERKIDVLNAKSYQSLFENFSKKEVDEEIEYQLDHHAGPFLDKGFAKELKELGFNVRASREDELDHFFRHSHSPTEKILEKGVEVASLENFGSPRFGNLSRFSPEEKIASWKRLGYI